MIRGILDRVGDKRVLRNALAALGVCAILFQALFSNGALSADLGQGAAAICASTADRGPDAPDVPSHHDRSCCILGCVAFGAAYVLVASNILPPFRSERSDLRSAPESIAPPVFAGFDFAARGPPSFV